MAMRQLSLFTGSGIGDLAAKAAGIETVAQCENDPCCQFILRRLWPEAHLFKDVRDVTATTLGRLVPIDIISGGFPCQDISAAGKGAGLGSEANPTRSGLWFEMLRVISEVRPTWVLAENVPALRVRGADTVLSGLEAEGYTCWPVLVGAWAVGAPHKRDRVWIVGRLVNASGAGICGQQHRRMDARRETEDQGQANNYLPHRSSTGDVADSPSIGRNTGGSGAADIGIRGATTEESTQRRAVHFGGGSVPVRWPARPGEPQRGAEGGIAAGGASKAVADADSDGRQGALLGSDLGPQFAAVAGGRWPARPGEPQHEWEWERLLRTDHPFVPKPGDPNYSRWTKRVGEPLQSVGSTTDGISRRVFSRANKSMLRILGNAWCYPLAEILFRWIAEQDRLMTKDPLFTPS